MCKEEVTTEDAVKGDTQSNGLIDNTVILLRGIIRTIKCHIESGSLRNDSRILPCLVAHGVFILSRCQNGRDGGTACERLLGKILSQEFVPFGDKVLAYQVSADPTNRMNPRYKFGFWLGMGSNSADSFFGAAQRVFRALEIRWLVPHTR